MKNSLTESELKHSEKQVLSGEICSLVVSSLFTTHGNVSVSGNGFAKCI